MIDPVRQRKIIFRRFAMWFFLSHFKPPIKIQRKIILCFGSLSVRLTRRWNLHFPKRSVPLNCCSSLAAYIFLLTTFFLPFLPCAIPVPALRPCLTNTAFASSLVRSALLHCVTSPVSIISGDGCSIFKVQCIRGDFPLIRGRDNFRLFYNQIEKILCKLYEFNYSFI